MCFGFCFWLLSTSSFLLLASPILPIWSLSPLNNQTINVLVGGGSETNYRSVITRGEAEPPVCFNSSRRAVCLGAGREGKGLLMETHSELIAGHYTSTGRDQRKELNGRWRRALVNHHTHTHTLCEDDTPQSRYCISGSFHKPSNPDLTFPTANTVTHTPQSFRVFPPDYSITVEFV